MYLLCTCMSCNSDIRAFRVTLVMVPRADVISCLAPWTWPHLLQAEADCTVRIADFETSDLQVTKSSPSLCTPSREQNGNAGLPYCGLC